MLRHLRSCAFAAATGFAVVLGVPGIAGAATVTLSCGAVGLELEICKEGAEAWAEKTGNRVEVISTPNSATERLALYQQILAANSADIDVFQIDVIWPGILADHFIDLSAYIPKEEIDQHFRAIVENNTVDGRFIAMPWFTDAGLLYYRKDLLEKYGRPVPQTWQEREETARTVGTIAPEGVLNYAEDESRGVFQSGNAVFMRNWPYAWALSQAEDSPIRGKVGVAALPKGGPDGKHTGGLGGWQLAGSKYSENPEVAADLVRYLTSYDEQKRRAIKGSYNPTIEALYRDEEVLAAVPFFGSLYDTFVNAVARPSRVTGAKYNQVSAEFFNTVHAVLSKELDAKTAVAQLERKLERISRGGRW